MKTLAIITIFVTTISTLMGNTIIPIEKSAYSILYSCKYKIPILVSYRLNGKEQSMNGYKKRFSFKVERSINKKCRSSNKFYKNEPYYDKGHMAPDASFDHNRTLAWETYYLSNVVPMYKRVNRVDWRKAESYERKLAIKYGNVNVVNLVYVDIKTVKTDVAIPSEFYKILWTDDLSVHLVFKYKNIPEPGKSSLVKHHVNIKELNKIDFASY